PGTTAHLEAAGAAGRGPPGHGRLHGQVVGASGAPVPHAKVTLIDHHGRQAGAAHTDGSGRYAVPVPRGGAYVLAATAAGHAPRASSATHHGGDGPVTVDLALPMPAL
ncbi:carboxypeptidase-like regulatory domain-containing protein, partial [Streptomyces hundungensis]|uniref:carboxypeptidase-like regulatory domain-containing protein n=1 Tax=Streptomyces hundungensis TaxID=1077946 RepID=UPI0033FC17B8